MQLLITTATLCLPIKKQFDRAIKDYEQALLLGPRYSNAYHNRAIAYHMKREYQKALADMERMQQLGYKIDEKFLKVLRVKVKER